MALQGIATNFRSHLDTLDATTGYSFTGENINATGNKFAYVGQVWFPARTGTKDIRRVCLRWNTVVKAGGSALTISLQDVSTANGPPMQPDETQDQTVAIPNADANFVSNTWYRSAALSADRTVAFGARLAVVVEYDGSGRLGADNFQVSRLSDGSQRSNCMCVTKIGGTWSVVSGLPNVILEFSDGTFGTLFGGLPCSAEGELSFNSGSTPDEYALEATFSKDVKIDLASWMLTMASSSADFDLVVYDGTTPIATVSCDASMRNSAIIAGATRTFAAPLALTGGTTYRFAIKPTTANNVVIQYVDVADANHFTCHAGGTAWTLTSRTDAGSWAAATTTRRPIMFPHVIFDFALGAPPEPAADYPCQVGTPVIWGATRDVNGNVFMFSKRPLRDPLSYYGGFKSPSLLQAGPMRREASDFLTGTWQAQTAWAKIADMGRVFRDLLNQPSLISQEAWIYLLSENTRLVQGNPTLLFHGPIYNDPFSEDFTYTLNINDYVGTNYNLFKEDKQIPQRTCETDDFPGLPNEARGLGVPIIGGSHAKSGGAIKVFSVGILTVSAVNYAVAMVCGHACAGGIQQAYDSSGTPLNWGTDAYAPGQSGWTTIQPGGELYWDINGNRYTLIFMPTANTLGTNFLDGTEQIYVDVDGMEPTGVGTGTVIEELFEQRKYLFKQWYTQSYRAGSWLSGLTFEFYPGMGVGYEVIDNDSFDAAQAQSVVYVGGVGFKGAFVKGFLGRRRSVREEIAADNVSSCSWQGLNARNRIFVYLLDRTNATFLGSHRVLKDRFDILSQTKFKIEPKLDWFANDLAYQYAANYRDDGRGDWDGFNIQGNAPSKDKYGVHTGKRVYELVSDQTTADTVASLQLIIGGTDPPRIVTWSQSLCGMAQDILTGWPMTHYQGRGSAGWVENPVLILSQEFSPADCRTTFTGLDVVAILLGVD